MAKVEFKSEIKNLKSELARAESELEALLDQSNAYESEIAGLRSSLDDLKAALDGRVPQPRSRKGLQPVPTREETGRPKRGARKEQIQNICRTLGRGGDSFRTAAVLEELRRIEDDVSDGIRSYTYAVMSTLESEKFVEKVGRGTWVLC